jgi:hypothetical protein
MKYNCPRVKVIKAVFKINDNILLTELEWKFGFLKRYKMRYLLVKNISVRPTDANIAITGWRVRKNDVKNAVLIIYVY